MKIFHEPHKFVLQILLKAGRTRKSVMDLTKSFLKQHLQPLLKIDKKKVENSNETVKETLLSMVIKAPIFDEV